MATEKRLIDANALVVPKYKMEGRDLFNQGYCQGKTDGILEVKAIAPTVDAVEVVHGRWIPYLDGDSIMPDRYYRCSECCDRGWGRKWPYCPNCGAKMDGDGNG